MRLFLLSLAFTASLFATEEYTIAIVPQFPNSVIKKTWEPVLDEVAKQTGIKFNIKYYSSIPDFEKAFLNATVDFAYLNPYHAVIANKAEGYKPFIRAEKPLVGILVVKKDSAYKSVKELNNKEIAFPAPNAFAASLWMRALLSEEEDINFTPKYVKTHSNVYKEVVLNLADAGGGVNKTLNAEPLQIKDTLRTLYTTKPSPSHPIAAKPNINAQVIEKFKTAIFNIWAYNPTLLKEIGFENPISTDYKEYQQIERLKLDKYAIIEK